MFNQPQNINDQRKQDEQNLKVESHVLELYELIEVKGKGAYGIVWKARDKKSNQIVALKKVFDAFQNSTDAQRTFREVMFLEQLKNHENIIKLYKVIRAQNDKDLYMVFGYMETDLHKVVRANILEPVHKQYIIYQLLKALKYKLIPLKLRYIHSGGLIHRDLKPANLLVDGECIMKLADFGLARTLNQNDEMESPMLTEYVATRWYRAPEILLGSQKYSKAVDMWSVGCILGETLINKAIFPGTSTMNQVELVMELLGVPNKEDIESIQAPLAAHVLQSIQTDKKKKSFKQLFSTATQEQLDFLRLKNEIKLYIRNLLVFNPNKRMTVEQALNHPYLKEFQGTEIEPVLSQPIQIIMNDNVQYSKQEYRKVLYSQINTQTKSYLPPSLSPKKSPTSNEQKSPSTFNVKTKINSSPSKNKNELSRKKQTQTFAKPTLYVKSEISEPSTTNSDKNKDFYKKPFFEDQFSKLQEKLQKLNSPQNQQNQESKKGYQSYKVLSDMIVQQKDGQTNIDVKKPMVPQQQQPQGKEEKKKTESLKQLFINSNTAISLVKTNSEQMQKLHKLVDKTQPPQEQSYNGTMVKLRSSIGSQQRVQHQNQGTIYQLGGRAQLFPQRDYTQLNQNRSSIDKPKNAINLSSIHLKSNSYIQKKKYFDYIVSNGAKK